MTDLAARIVREGGCYTLSGGSLPGNEPTDHQALVYFLRSDGQLRKGLGRHPTDPAAALRQAYDEARGAMTL